MPVALWMALATASRRPLPTEVTTFALAVQVQRDRGGDAVDLSKVCLDDIEGLAAVEEGVLEDVQHLSGTQLLVAVVGHALDLVARASRILGGRL